MAIKNNISRYNILVPIIILSFSACSITRYPQTMIWDKKNLKSFKTNGLYNEGLTIQEIMKTCDLIIKEAPVTVMNKENSFAPDMHYYCSVGPYWWLDSVSGKYILKDGYVNPDYYKYDVKRLSVLESRCKYLSLAFYYSGDDRYYDALYKQLYTWFCDTNTYMYPNFEYAQVVPGQNNNKGRSYGIIEAYAFNNIIESIRLMDSRKPLNKKLHNNLKRWFKKFAQWMDYGVFSDELKMSNNNIGVAYDVILSNIYLFVGNKIRATEICNDFVRRRLYVQINDNGEQPKELERTKAFSYSVFNLSNIIDFIKLAKNCNVDNIDAMMERTEAAFNYLSQFIGHKEKFPYVEISDWNACERSYNQQLIRFSKLKGQLDTKEFIQTTSLNSILY